MTRDLKILIVILGLIAVFFLIWESGSVWHDQDYKESPEVTYP